MSIIVIGKIEEGKHDKEMLTHPPKRHNELKYEEGREREKHACVMQCLNNSDFIKSWILCVVSITVLLLNQKENNKKRMQNPHGVFCELHFTFCLSSATPTPYYLYQCVLCTTLFSFH